MPRISRKQVRVGVVTALAVAGAGLSLSSASPASAAVSVSCNASGETDFSPGVQLYPQSHNVSYQGDLETCTDHSGNGILSANLIADINGVTLSCFASRFGTGSGTGTIQWNTAATAGAYSSTFDWKIDETTLNTGKVSGTVKSGLFANQPFTGTFTTNLLGGVIDCTASALLGGLKSTTFSGKYQIG